ncbi:beta-lactamase [Capronia epimyces CBS 606.96]|uniref:Beta-lactamase n=1 Tax=Capronia epimyces CBS 606.96 TaxID=1182542 RepID=W9YAS1_9EURO|nr:beta-lactamase [Capronia epimyces CBS 606.96]EXJ89937.1 beta-lactamase [Capronia epimyces CBS 606.96]
MARVEGQAEAPFEGLRELLAQQIASGDELGASIVVNIDGKNVVDLWGGHADEARTRPWTQDTITNVWSATKTVATLAVLVLADRGLVDVDAPVAQYWAEFGANGKQGVLVRHLLSHTSGVSGWEEPITLEQVEDLAVAVPRLAAQAPWWEPGTASGYHSTNMGHLLGELVRRVSGKPMKQFVADELAGPLGADFQIGAREEDWPRIAPVVPPPPVPFDMSKLDPTGPAVKTFVNPGMDARYSWTPGWRRADMAGVNGHGNARSLVRILSALSLGGKVDGVSLLSPATIDHIFRKQADGVDLVLDTPLTWGIGYALTSDASRQSLPWLPAGRVCFWGGWGGSLILMDLDRKLTFSYAMNRMSYLMTDAGPSPIGNVNAEIYLRAVYKALGVEGY